MPNTKFENRESHVSLSAIAVGTIFALILNLTFTMIGGAIGLASYSLDGSDSPNTLLWLAVIVYAAISSIAVFALSGYASARLSGTRRTWEAVMHGIATFSLATLLVVSAIGSVALTHLMIGDMRRGTVVTSIGALVLLAIGALASGWGAKRGMDAAIRADRIRNRHSGLESVAERAA
jgi:hypothetical protein